MSVTTTKFASASLSAIGLAIGASFLRAMAFAPMPMALEGCIADSGATDAATATTVDAGGYNCAYDPTTNTTFCSSTSVCPNVSVDPNSLPDCGFRPLGGGVFDLVCVCGNMVCPIGSPTSCDDATALLSGTSSGAVCNEVGQGQCAATSTTTTQSVTPAATGADAGATTNGNLRGGSGGAFTPSANCDQDCASGCDNVPTCLTSCGC